MSFLERMAKQGTNPTSINANPHDPMAHTFSSLSPKNQASAVVESKNLLNVLSDSLGVEEQSYINPFNIACRKDSDVNTEGEVTAEGFYKNPSDTCIETSRMTAREEVSPSILKSDSVQSRNASQSGTKHTTPTG